MKIKLTYFDVEGAAEPIRLALVLSKKDFEDDRIKFADWKELKAKTPHGQVPIMTIDDGPAVMTQSGAILRWVGATFSEEILCHRDKLFQVEEVIGILDDIKRSWEPKMYMGMKPTAFGRPDGFGKTEEGKELIKQMRTEWIANELPTLLDKSGGK